MENIPDEDDVTNQDGFPEEEEVKKPWDICTWREIRHKPEILLWYLGNMLSYLGFYMPFMNLVGMRFLTFYYYLIKLNKYHNPYISQNLIFDLPNLVFLKQPISISSPRTPLLKPTFYSAFFLETLNFSKKNNILYYSKT